MKIQTRFVTTSRIFGWAIALLLIVGFVGLAGTGRLMAQGITTGSITGTVIDPQGAVIPGATLTATNAATGVKLSTESLSNGAFSFRDLPIGDYSVDLSATGFNAGNIASVGVVAGVTTDLKMVKLGLSSSAQRVEVTGGTSPLLQVSESQVTTTFGSQTMANVPLNNAFDTVTEVIPGVVSAHADSFSNNNGDEFVVNGQSSRFNNFELDGQNNNDNTIGGPQVFFGNQDAIAEIQVISNDYSAQYGRDSGAVVNYITKSGTNTFHGSVFEYYQGQFLSSYENQQKSAAFGFCAPGQVPPSCGIVRPLPRFVENRYGATLGGPVLKDRLFFFGSGYWDRQFPGSSPSTSSSLTPNAAGITQLANTFPGNNAVAILQSSGPLAIPVGNPVSFGPVVPEDITGPGGVVATGVPFQFVQRMVASPFTDAEYLGRLDWQPTERDHLFGRYYYQTTVAQAASGDIPSGGYVNVTGITHSVGADWTHTFNSNWVDQLRYSFQQAVIAFEGGGDPNCTISDPTVCPPQVIFNDTSESFGLNTAFPQGRVVKVTQVQNNATWTHGNQTILFGGEVDYQNTPTTGLFNYNGTFNFGTFSNFIQDAPGAGNPAISAALFLSNGNITVKFKETDIAGYIEDDWKVTPTLTANIGLRWEYFSPFSNVYHDQTVARESNPATAFWDPTLPLADRTFPKVNQFFKGFEPRLGFAWNPAFAPKMVVRGGYAINRDPPFYNIGLLAGSGAPIAIAGTIFCTGGSTCLPSGGKFTGGAVRTLNLPLFPVGGDPRMLDQSTVPSNLVPPYTQTYTLAVDRQLGNAAVIEVRYVGSLTEKNFQSIDGNPYLLPVQTDFPAFAPVTLCSDPTQVGYGRPNCNYGNVSVTGNGGWANYNGLQTNLTTRNLHGMTGTLSYTYSKSLDNATDAFRSTGAGGSSIAFAQNPLDTDAGERGVSGNSYTHAVGAQFTYLVPELHIDNGLLARVANGFFITSLYRYSSGQPYTPFQPIGLDGNTGDTSYCDGAFNGSSVAVGVDTCRLIRSNKNAPLSTVAYYNPYTGPVVNGSPTLGTPIYVVYGSDGFTSPTTYYPGTPIDPTTAHWIIDNKAYAQLVHNPYPGSSRGAQVGDNYSELDATIVKNTKITHGIQLQVSLAAYNVLNQMYRGSPGTFVANPTTFGSYNFSAGTNIPGAAASGTRFLLLGSKVIF